MNRMRWRHGDTNPVDMRPMQEDAVFIGDLLYYEMPGIVRPASCFPAYRSEQERLQEFRSRFAGVAMQSSPKDSIEPIRVATTGVFEFDCSGWSLKNGDRLAPVLRSSNSCEVGPTEQEDRAIGSVAKVGQYIVLMKIDTTEQLKTRQLQMSLRNKLFVYLATCRSADNYCEEIREVRGRLIELESKWADAKAERDKAAKDIGNLVGNLSFIDGGKLYEVTVTSSGTSIKECEVLDLRQ